MKRRCDGETLGVVLLMLVSSLIGCDGKSPSTNQPVPATNTQVGTKESGGDKSAAVIPASMAASGMVTAAQGGVVATADKAVSLTVLPGAVAADVLVKFRYTALPANGEMPAGGEIALEPSGTTFAKPAQLTIRVPDAPPENERVAVYSLSKESPSRRSIAETTRFERLPAAKYDVAEKKLTVPVAHFSWITWAFEKPAYLVFDIPGKYLKRGDLIYTLSERTEEHGGSWFPGHAGMYLGNKVATAPENDGETIIESTVMSEAYGTPDDGVQPGTLTNFRSGAGQHIYMGARRPTFTVSDETRVKLAKYALGKLKTPYSELGGTLLFGELEDHKSKLSCVGLTESTYKAATGRDIVPLQLQPLLTPIRQFYYTRPVNEVELTVGETFRMNVYGVYQDAQDLYSDDLVGQKMEVHTYPDILEKGRAALSKNGVFLFKPNEDDLKHENSLILFRFSVEKKSARAAQPLSAQFYVKLKPKEIRAFAGFQPGDLETIDPRLESHLSQDTKSASGKLVYQTVFGRTSKANAAGVFDGADLMIKHCGSREACEKEIAAAEGIASRSLEGQPFQMLTKPQQLKKRETKVFDPNVGVEVTKGFYNDEMHKYAEIVDRSKQSNDEAVLNRSGRIDANSAWKTQLISYTIYRDCVIRLDYRAEGNHDLSSERDRMVNACKALVDRRS